VPLLEVISLLAYCKLSESAAKYMFIVHLLYVLLSTCDHCEWQVYGYFQFMIHFFIPLILLGFAYWKILTVVRRKAKVAANRQKTMAMAKDQIAGTTKGKAEPVANTGSNSDKSGRDKGVYKEVMPAASSSTSQQAGKQNNGLSKAKMNVIRTMIYIFIVFVICWLPFNGNLLYTRITVRRPVE